MASGTSLMKYKLLTVTPAVQATPDYSAGDVLFSPTEIPNFFPNKNSAAQIVSICIIDKQVVSTHDFTLYFTHSAASFGTINATADAAIGTLEEIQAVIPIVAGDWVAGGGAGSVDNANICMLTTASETADASTGLGAVVAGYNWARNSFSTSLHIVGIAGETMNVASTSDLIIKIGVRYL